MEANITREAAWELLKKYNKEPFHLQHALTLEGVMRWFSTEQGFGADAASWGLVGLLHDIDFELYPDQHCKKAPELLAAGGVNPDMIRAICSHGYSICTDIRPEHVMEKILFTVDELTGLIGAVALMHPSKSVMDMKVSSVRKKFKDKRFAAGCSRDIITCGAEMLGWEMDDLFTKTIQAMQACEAEVQKYMDAV